MSSIKLSIILPVYNGEKTIRTCLDSLFPIPDSVEIICVNDGSTDRTQQILKEYSQSCPMIRVVQKKKGGVSAACNKGLKTASGEWVSFIHCDDFVEKGALSSILEMLDKPVQLVCWGAKVVSSKNLPWLKSTRRYHAIKQKGEVAANLVTLSHNTVTVWNKAFKRDILLKKQICFPKDLVFEDTYFYWIYVPWVKNIYFSDQYLYNYVQSENSIVGRWQSGQFSYAMDFLSIFCRVCSYYQKHGIFVTHQQYLHYLFRSCLVRALEKNDKYAVLDSFGKELKKIKFGTLSSTMKVVLNKRYRYVFPGKVLCGWERVFAVTNIENRKVVFVFGFPIIPFPKK